MVNAERRLGRLCKEETNIRCGRKRTWVCERKLEHRRHDLRGTRTTKKCDHV
jgi:hypothetical protein